MNDISYFAYISSIFSFFYSYGETPSDKEICIIRFFCLTRSEWISALQLLGTIFAIGVGYGEWKRYKKTNKNTERVFFEILWKINLIRTRVMDCIKICPTKNAEVTVDNMHLLEQNKNKTIGDIETRLKEISSLVDVIIVSDSISTYIAKENVTFAMKLGDGLNEMKNILNEAYSEINSMKNDDFLGDYNISLLYRMNDLIKIIDNLIKCNPLVNNE